MMWQHAPDKLILAGQEAHVWRASLDVDETTLSSFFELLSADEKNRAQKFRFEKDRHYFITARGILRTLLGKYLETNPREISFQYSEFGKPSIAGNNSLQFNISHAQNWALFAFTRNYNIGVDIECINPDIEIEDIATKFFSANEVKNLLALPKGQQAAGFFNCWTRKEAFIKAVGEGLSFPLSQFEVSLEPDKPARLLATHWNEQAFIKWSMFSLAPAESFVGSLAIEGVMEKIHCFNFSFDC